MIKLSVRLYAMTKRNADRKEKKKLGVQAMHRYDVNLAQGPVDLEAVALTSQSGSRGRTQAGTWRTN